MGPKIGPNETPFSAAGPNWPNWIFTVFFNDVKVAHNKKKRHSFDVINRGVNGGRRNGKTMDSFCTTRKVKSILCLTVLCIQSILKLFMG